MATVFFCPCSNPDLRRTEPVLESPLQRTSSGSSSSSSTPSSQPSSQGGSQPGSQAGSSERTRVRGKHSHNSSILSCLGGKPQAERKGCFLTLPSGWPLLCDTGVIQCLMLVSSEGTGLESLIVHMKSECEQQSCLWFG